MWKRKFSPTEKIEKVMSHPNARILPQEDVEQIKSYFYNTNFQNYDLVEPIMFFFNDFDIEEEKKLYKLFN